MIRARFVLPFLCLALMALPACRTNPHRSPGGTVVGSTAAGAGLGALIGWAAGDAGAGAAIGAGVGLIAGAIQADEDAQARDELESYSRRRRVVVREASVQYDSPYADRELRARDLLARAQRTPSTPEAIRLLKRSLTEFRTPEAHTALGEIYEYEGSRTRAAGEYRRALDLDPDYRPARDHLARMGR